MAALARVGRIVKAHGIRGGVVARPAADGSDVLLHVTAVTLERAGKQEERKVKRAQWQGKQVLLELEGLADRNAAEALVGAELLLPEDQLPEPDEGEFYRDELLGLEVVDASGKLHGKVVELESSPMQEWLVVDAGGREVLVPFTEGLVVEVDVDGGRIVVDAPEGLFDGDAVS